MDYSAHNKDYKSKDALTRASYQHQLPISWHLSDVTALIHAEINILIGYSSTGHVAVDSEVNSSRSVNKKAHVWQDATYPIDVPVDSASAITDLNGAIYHPRAKKDATYLEIDASSYSKFKLLDHVAESRFVIRNGDVTTSDKHDSTHGTIIFDATIGSMPFDGTISTTRSPPSTRCSS